VAFKERHEDLSFSSRSPIERDVLDATVRLVAACAEGFDGPLLDAVRDALLEVFEFDGLAILVEDEGNGDFRLVWHSAVGLETRSPISPGEHHTHPRAFEGFSDPPSQTRPRVVDDARTRDNELATAASKMGVLSYVVVPLCHRERALGWLVVSHRVLGAPSQRFLPLLIEIAALFAPAIARARGSDRQRLFAAIFEGSPDGMLALDPTGAVTEANPQALCMLGLSRSEVVGKPIAALVDEPTFARLLRGLLRETPSNLPPIEIQLGPSRVPIDATVARLSSARDGSLLVHLRDARARKAFEDAASRRVEQAAFLRALGEAMAGVLRADKAMARAVDLCFVRFELGALCALRAEGDDTLRLVAAHGASSDLLARLARPTEADLASLFGDDGVELTKRKRALEKTDLSLPGDALAAGKRWMMFVPLIHARRRLGALVVVGHAGDPLSQSQRETWEPIASTISVALRASEDFERVVALEAEKRQLVDNLPVIVARLDPRSGATLFANAALHRVLGVRASDLGPGGTEELLADSVEREASAGARARAAAGIATGWQDRRYRHQDGQILTLRECVYPVWSAAHEVHAVEVIAYDITTEIDARKQLMQSDRLASLGTLAAGVAHEINNPIAFISLATGQMIRLIDQAKRREPGAHERLREMAGEITESAARIAEIVGELKLFTRIPEGASACPVDINRVLQTAITLTAADVRRHARLEVNLGALPLAPGGFAGLGHVFANLLINAAQAIDSKHESASASREPDVVRVTSTMQGGAIVVRIDDTGIGIDEKMLPRIFDPFLKVRAGGQGAGLGLAIAYDLVTRVGGDIRVVSSSGTGTSFEIVLPLEPALAAADDPASARIGEPGVGPASVPPARTLSPLRRVLIIDDERTLVKALARQLSERYEVDTASTATDALAQLSVNSYDAVVCDLRMPEQSGPAIYAEVESRSPAQASRFIFTTGGSYGAFDDEPHARAEATGLPVLEKPFDGASFEAAVERVASRPLEPSI
jgi:PAS domain S-box-containing protein